ncbi:unnamed protein product, partial [marine sediment metagenome]
SSIEPNKGINVKIKTTKNKASLYADLVFTFLRDCISLDF